jgi:hypothetical protein
VTGESLPYSRRCVDCLDPLGDLARGDPCPVWQYFARQAEPDESIAAPKGHGPPDPCGFFPANGLLSGDRRKGPRRRHGPPGKPTPRSWAKAMPPLWQYFLRLRTVRSPTRRDRPRAGSAASTTAASTTASSPSPTSTSTTSTSSTTEDPLSRPGGERQVALDRAPADRGGALPHRAHQASQVEETEGHRAGAASSGGQDAAAGQPCQSGREPGRQALTPQANIGGVMTLPLPEQ